MSTNEGADVLLPPEVALPPRSLQRQVVHGQHHHLRTRSRFNLQDRCAAAEGAGPYLLPGEPQPLEALLAVLRTVAAQKLEEVVSLQVTGLVAVELTWNHNRVRMLAC